jgi:hypothetical protein
MTATRYETLAPPTDPADSRICRIEGIAYPYIYALACMFLTMAAVVTLAS